MSITRQSRSDYIVAQNTEFKVKIEDGKAFIISDATRSGGFLSMPISALSSLSSLLIEVELELKKGERL